MVISVQLSSEVILFKSVASEPSLLFLLTFAF